LQITTWIPLRYWGVWGGGNFIDTMQILRYGECYKTIGLSVYGDSGINCSNYLYGRTLLQLLSILGINSSWTQIIGYVFLLILAVGLSMIFPVKNPSDCWLFLAVVLSPPVMLLAERGNFDIIIFFLLITTAKMAARNNYYLAFILLALTVLLKFYTLPIFLLLIFTSKQFQQRLFGTCLLLVLAITSIRDIAITKADFPHSSGGQFGFTVWGEYLNGYSSTQINEIQKYILSFLVFALIFLVGIYFYQKTQSPEMNEHKPLVKLHWESFAFKIFLVVSISCYFAGMNFDYRLIYLAATLLLIKRDFSNFHAKYINVCLLAALWLSFPSGGLQPIGDALIEGMIAYFFVVTVIATKRSLRSDRTKKLARNG
jgi:hypothetical protein